MNISNGVYFVSGIDTDCGKSYVTGVLAKRIMEQSKSCITQKFIQTGGENTDIEIHREIMGTGLLEEDKNFTTAPVIFTYPASPHLAAKLDNLTINFDAIAQSTATLMSKYDVVLIEGAGGLHVPLEGLYTTIDYIVEKSLSLIFVTSGKLGSINHTLLSLELCRNRGIDVAIVVYNHYFDDDDVISSDTFAYIRSYLAHYHQATQLIEIERI